MVTDLGAASIPSIFIVTVSGYLLCLFLAELSAMMPTARRLTCLRLPAYKDRWPRFAEHINGFTAWAYWLGWFPVAPLNMILASFYIAFQLKLNTTSDSRRSTPSSPVDGGDLRRRDPAPVHPRIPRSSLRHVLRDGTGAVVDDPLTFLAISWIFHPAVAHFSQLSSFAAPDGAGFFSNHFGHGWFTIYIAFAFLLTWNVIAMEAAACYIGETRIPIATPRSR